ncbi:hypothetical protein JR316_0009042 [Psilocybe cubensis]|uniref:Uncharacterized protein n=2 Tax=Psilocybe cubensis TaxID=181762 RepID=A0ACB8GS81_PSICU|nr:hypothetical protein JR316_0009042 [Psilocybe cubensis]KAH9478585.1 hypothetical protein JR316_0009042 [Psilocybe cubensis]
MNLSLWKALFRRVSMENSLLISECGMTLKDYENAATAPARFLSSFQSSNQHGIPLKVYSSHYIDTDLLRDIPVFSESVSAVYLVPGGQFMLTQHEGFTSEIHLWDLGAPGKSDRGHDFQDLLPLASLEDRSFLSSLPAHPTGNGQGIILFACKDALGEEEGECERDIFVYEIYPMLEGASFRQIATQSYNYSANEDLSYAFNHNKLVMFVDEGIVRIWDYVTSTQATWSVPMYPIISNIFLRGEIVIIQHSNLVSLYTIPELHTLDSSLSSDAQSWDPIFSSELPSIPQISPQFEVEAPDPWYNQSELPIHIDSLIYSEGEEPYNQSQSAIRYRLYVSSLVDEYLSNRSASQLHNKESDFTTIPASDGCLEGYRFCEKQMISFSSFDKGLSIQRAQMDITNVPLLLDQPRMTTAVHRCPQNEKTLVSLCSASGRFVNCHAERLLIEIVDFLPHPSSEGKPLPEYESDSD